MLVERDALLADLGDSLDAALEGQGGLVFIGGEAGVGKSTLVRAFAAAATGRGAVRTGGVDNVTTADALAAFQDAVPDVIERLVVGSDRTRAFRELREALRCAPGLLVLEDLHWADEATLDALRFLARRLDDFPLLVLATYRHDEVAARHPLSLLLGDLATVPRVRRLRVPPLTVEGVAVLAGRSRSADEAAALHARTHGNPFFVTELLAAGGDDVPVTVSDAVLARVARLSPGAQDAAAAAAVLGTAVAADLLSTVAARDLEMIDECVEAGVLIASAEGFGFRHELARDAVERSLSAVRRRRLHQRALRVLTERTPEDHRTLAHHAAGAFDDDAAARHATLAAERAARLGAHREAATEYRLALRHESAPAARATLFVALSYECYLTDQLPEALTARQRAIELHELGGDARLLGDAERWLSRLSWFLGRGRDAERYAVRALATLEPLGPSRELAMAYSNLAQLRMLADDPDEAELWARRALDLAVALGAIEIQAHALNNLGTAMIERGDVPQGEELLLRSCELALSEDLHEHVARAYTNLGAPAVAQRRFAAGLGYLDAGIAYCRERDLDSWARYMQSWRCVALGDLGRFEEALDGEIALLRHPDISAVSAIPAAASAARIAARRGEETTQYLSIAHDLASGTTELQRIAPAACAAAEVAWLVGDLAGIAPATEAAWALALTHADAWSAGELAWWRTIAGVHVHAPVTLADPFRLAIDGDPEAAARAWEALGSPVWAAYMRGLSPDAATAGAALRALGDLGAESAVDAILRTRVERGLPLPRRPRAAARARPGQLTARELEVLGLLAQGLSTADIATQLVLSPRTVEHHISAVLRKLGQPTRARAVAAARDLGVGRRLRTAD